MRLNVKKITTVLTSISLFALLALPVSAEINKETGLPEFGLESGSISDWKNIIDAADPTKTYFEVSSEKSFSGSYSIKGIDPSSTDAIAIHSPLVEITPGEEYSGSAQMFNPGDGRASLLIRYYDADKKPVGNQGLVTHQMNKNEWKETTVNGGIAPAEAKYIVIGPSISGLYATSGTYWDDFKLYGNFPEAPAVGEYSFSGNEFVRANNEFEVTLNTANNDDLYSIVADIEYDTTQLTFNSARGAGEFSNSVVTVDDETAGRVSVVATLTGESGVSVNSDVLTFVFTPTTTGAANVKLLSTSITAKVNGDSTGKAFSPAKEVVYSFIIVESTLDVNGDGKVNLIDLTSVAHYVGTDATDETAKYDVNMDGKIDIADLGVIANTIFNQ